MIPVHQPVMADEVMEHLLPPGENLHIIDGTLGEGGHSLRFLQALPECRVTGIDVDAVMAERARERLSDWEDRFDVRVGWTDEVLSAWDGPAPHVVLMDLGISVFHYEGRGQGFSFQKDEPLDMRLEAGEGRSAADMVNTLREDELADVIFQYGEERFSRRIARRIVEERAARPILRSEHLAKTVLGALPPQARRGRLHGATRTFQALRIAVNRELERLGRLLELVPGMLAPGGRLGIISFHSLEDRMVKQKFRELDSRFGGSFELFTRKPLRPGEDECRRNPPSRSARFRIIGKPSGGVL